MGRIYDALRRADVERGQVERDREQTVDDRALRPTGATARGERGLADDVHSLAAQVERFESRLDQAEARTLEWASEQVAALEVSIGALEDRVGDGREDEPARTGSLAGRIHALEARLGAAAAELFERVTKVEHRLPALLPTGPSAADVARSLEPRLEHVGQQLDALASRVAHELPGLRAELGETIDKRVHTAAAQLVGRENVMRDRLDARIDALRRDLDRGQRRQALIIAGVLLAAVVAYSC
jgi:hypothetical protein